MREMPDGRRPRLTEIADVLVEGSIACRDRTFRVRVGRAQLDGRDHYTPLGVQATNPEAARSRLQDRNMPHALGRGSDVPITPPWMRRTTGALPLTFGGR